MNVQRYTFFFIYKVLFAFLRKKSFPQGGAGGGVWGGDRRILGEMVSYGCTTFVLYFSLGSPMMRI